MLDFNSDAAVAGAIQYTNVRPDLTRDDLITHVETCVEAKFHAAMVPPCWIPLTREILTGSGVRIATTLNFPQANDAIEMKLSVLKLIAKAGAEEVDFPPNPGFLLSGMEAEYRNEIQLIVNAAHETGMVAKAMLEFGFLPSNELRVRAVQLACSTGIDWIKQSSGWGDGGISATVEDVLLMKQNLNGNTRIKVSGKVNTREKMRLLFEAGAELVGTSSAVAILRGEKGNEDAY